MIEQFIFGRTCPRGFDADSLNNIQRTNLRDLGFYGNNIRDGFYK